MNVTQPAVTQYLNRKRGSTQDVAAIDRLVVPVAEKLAKRIRSGLAGVEPVELFETARQVMVMSTGGVAARSPGGSPKRAEAMEFLRGRLQLELKAAEKYLELSNKTGDDYTKLLLRMIAADSIRHGDVVSQIISWLEAERTLQGGGMLDDVLIKNMLALEDSAGEASLRENVEIGHPVARLLLQWIDIDESKHERILRKLLSSTIKGQKKTHSA